MHLVPIIPQPKVGIEERLKVTGVAAVKTSTPVGEEAQPPSINLVPEKSAPVSSEITRPVNSPVAERYRVNRQEERRKACRRIAHHDMQEELRSAIDRRKHKRREKDMEPHIDEEA